jgi:hypothetical protein
MLSLKGHLNRGSGYLPVLSAILPVRERGVTERNTGAAFSWGSGQGSNL